MNQEGDQGVSQSGFTRQVAWTMSPLSSKRNRDEREEEERHSICPGVESEYAKTVNLNVLSDGGRAHQGLLISNLSKFLSEKRIKCGPSNPENNSPNPISSSGTKNKGVVALDGENKIGSGKTTENVIRKAAGTKKKVSDTVAKGCTELGSKVGTRFQCDVCSIKCTSTKNLRKHLVGKRHARALELASIVRTASVIKSVCGDSQSESHTQKVKAPVNNGCADGSGEASKGVNPSETSGKEVNVGTSSSKCPNLNDANAVAIEPHSSMDCSLKDVLAKDSLGKSGCNDSHNKIFMNGTVYNPTLTAAGFLEKICGKVISEEEPYKCLAALLSAKSHSDCIAQALASVVSFYACPGVGHVQEGSSCEPSTGCLDSQLAGAKSTDNEDMVTMHTRCFTNLLYDVRVAVMEGLLRHGGLNTKIWLPSSAPVSASASTGEALNCCVCRVEYGSKADRDLHIAGRKHASLVQRVESRCQLCNLNCNSERQYKSHLSGKKHTSKLGLVQKRVTF